MSIMKLSNHSSIAVLLAFLLAAACPSYARPTTSLRRGLQDEGALPFPAPKEDSLDNDDTVPDRVDASGTFVTDDGVEEEEDAEDDAAAEPSSSTTDVTKDLMFDTFQMVEQGTFTTFRSSSAPGVDAKAKAISCQTIGPAALQDTYEPTISLQAFLMAGSSELIIEKVDNDVLQHCNVTDLGFNVNYTGCVFYVEIEAIFEIQVRNENTEDIELYCKESDIQDLPLGVGVPLIHQEGSEIEDAYYKVESTNNTEALDDRIVFCKTLSTDADPSEEAFVDLELRSFEVEDRHCFSYGGDTCDLMVPGDDTVVVKVSPYGNFSLTCFAGYVEEMVMVENNESSTTFEHAMELEIGSQNQFLYTTTPEDIPGKMVCSIQVDDAAGNSEELELHVAYNVYYNEFYGHEKTECSVTGSDSCFLGMIGGANVTLIATVTSSKYSGPATLKCTAVTQDEEVLDLEADAPVTIQLAANDVKFFSFESLDTVGKASCSATIDGGSSNSNSTDDKQVVLSYFVPSPYIYDTDGIRTLHANPTATAEWFAWPDPGAYALLLGNYKETDQDVELECSLTTLEPIGLGNRTSPSSEIVTLPVNGMDFLVDLGEFTFPLTLSCNMTFVAESNEPALDEYGGPVFPVFSIGETIFHYQGAQTGTQSSSYHMEGASRSEEFLEPPPDNLVIISASVEDPDGVFDRVDDRNIFSCDVYEGLVDTYT